MARYFPSGLSATAVGRLFVCCGEPGTGVSSFLLEGNDTSFLADEVCATAVRAASARTQETIRRLTHISFTPSPNGYPSALRSWARWPAGAQETCLAPVRRSPAPRYVQSFRPSFLRPCLQPSRSP